MTCVYGPKPGVPDSIVLVCSTLRLTAAMDVPQRELSNSQVIYDTCQYGPEYSGVGEHDTIPDVMYLGRRTTESQFAGYDPVHKHSDGILHTLLAES